MYYTMYQKKLTLTQTRKKDSCVHSDFILISIIYIYIYIYIYICNGLKTLQYILFIYFD